MQSILKSLKTVSDPNRLRILLLLEHEELTVAEMQEILAMSQSTLSTHLAQLKQAGLVEDRRAGKNVHYRLDREAVEPMWALLSSASREIAQADRDRRALRLAMQRRQDKVRAYFDELAGKFGRHYLPGRSWKGLAEMLLKLMPPMVIADLGAGEGTFSQLLAQRAAKVIAVDNSEKMVAYGTELAARNGLANLEYRLGELEAVPIEDASVDLAFLSQALHHAQHPPRAVREAWRILKPGGRIAILDLAEHHFEEARELYHDLWPGFSEVDMVRFLEEAGFDKVETAIVHREDQPPHLETLLAIGEKPAL
jgi:ArsR family transcriptional regulator